FFSSPSLPTGGHLFADVTTGYGPECFAIPGTPTAFPYKLEANYYARGPMGYGMGKLEVIEHDGRGRLAFDESQFVVMNAHAYVPLGEIRGPVMRKRTKLERHRLASVVPDVAGVHGGLVTVDPGAIETALGEELPAEVVIDDLEVHAGGFGAI